MEAGVARLQVEELSAAPASAPELAAPTVFSEAESGAVPMALEATEPGVMVGSSVGSFICAVPFHAFPGTNSGMPKLSVSSVEALVLTGLLSLLPESGQPLVPPPLDHGPLDSG